MARQNIERQNELEPERMDYAIKQITDLGISAFLKTDKSIQFSFKGQPITLWPYSGYFSGKTVTAGRGIKNLIDQLKTK